MSKEGSSDWFARAIATLSLVVAIAAIAVPYFQHKVEQEEAIALDFNPHLGGDIKLTDYNFGEIGRIVQVLWQLRISNTGNRKLSIVEYSISSGDKPYSKFFSGMDGGILDLKGNRISLPITLEPGDSLALQVYVGIMVSPKIFNILNDSRMSKPIPAQQAARILGRAGLDLYGNNVDFKEYKGGNFHLAVRKGAKSPRYWFCLVTGRGKSFVISASEYDHPK